jgi:hypothetical protein
MMWSKDTFTTEVGQLPFGGVFGSNGTMDGAMDGLGEHIIASE